MLMASQHSLLVSFLFEWCCGLKRFLAQVSEAMQVSERILLKYKDGPEVIMPPTLILHDEDGQKWVKFQPSHYSVVKLILGHVPNFNKQKNPSLSNCDQFSALQSMMKEELKKNVSSGGAEDVFEEEEAETASKASNARAQRALLQNAPRQVKVTLGDVDVFLKVPSSWKCADVTVQLDEHQLTAVCDFIMDGVESTASNKRKYSKCGGPSKTKRPA